MDQQILYSQFKETDFFSFFNLSEIQLNRVGTTGELIKIDLKPGGFQEYIDIILITFNSFILNAVLCLDREWIGNEETINPLSKDITKSFIATLFAEALNQEFKIFLVQSIWNMKGTKERVVCIDEAVHNWEDAIPEVKQFLEVFRGTQERAFQSFGTFSISMRNKIDNNKKLRFFITLDWKDI